MKCQECNDSLFDYLESLLSEKEAEGVKNHISTCPACNKAYLELSSTWNSLDQLPKPNPAMQQRFSAALVAYKQGQAEGQALSRNERNRNDIPLIHFWRNGYAQAASIAVAFFIGVFATQIVPGTGSAERFNSIEAELASLREFTALSLLNQTSATERIRGLGWLAQMRTGDSKILETLYNKLNYDPNINVRFAALETLDVYAENADVRRKLIELLGLPNSPLIRVELIKVLVRHSDHNSLPVLKRISQDSDENEVIRELAKWSVSTLEEGKKHEI